MPGDSIILFRLFMTFIMKDLIKFSIIALLFSACTSKASPEYQYSEQDILGTWSSLSLTVTYLDIDSVYVVAEGNWEDMLNIKPIKTTYTADSTYTSEYYDLDGALVFTSSGTWHFKNDSLFLESEGIITPYEFSLEENVGRFVGILDWNQDGEARERYDGKQEKL